VHRPPPVRRTLVIAAALLVAAPAALWLRLDELPAVASLPASPPFAARAPAATTAPAPDTPPEAPSPPSAAANGDGAEALALEMASRMQKGIAPSLVDYLAAQGLARTDAEPIVTALVAKEVDCGLAALRAQAIEQRVPFDDVLNALEAELYDADGPPLTALLDVQAVARHHAPCSLAALQQSGISPQAVQEVYEALVKARRSPRVRRP
jgi:hypothetical protein